MSDQRQEEATTPPGLQEGSQAEASATEASLVAALERLESSRLGKASAVPRVLELARKLMLEPGGIERLYCLAPRLDQAGLFLGTDWAQADALLPGFVRHTLEQGERHTIIIECLSELRMLAIANGEATHLGLSAEQARNFLTQVLALNLNRIFPSAQTEAERVKQTGLEVAVDQLFKFLLQHIGYEDILGSLVDEIWRILGQRPVQVDDVKTMVTQIAITLAQDATSLGDAGLGASRLISALFGPTQQCVDDPGLLVFRERLAALDNAALMYEARGFARAMHDVGLVSDYHADFLRWLLEQGKVDFIPAALGLSTTGLDVLRSYSQLVHELIREAIYPETSQAVYGLSMLLERGLLYQPSIAPALWRQLGLELSAQAQATLASVFGHIRPPRVYLLAGVIATLGQPLGVGQGNNPTCQSARAISMWSLTAPDYLLHLIAQVARFDTLQMSFEGQALNSADLPAGLVRMGLLDNAPVSTLLVPHLDRIYNEMGRRCDGRGEDPHRWINPEFHGWWVGRNFAIAVDIVTGNLKDYDLFIRRFLASYHPFHNGNQPVIHPQPAGLAVTDSAGQFVGWHAITLLRVALDHTGVMRAYFYNPNNDSGQNWGHGVEVSTQRHGERHGESSLPISQLASRLYIFHDDPLTVPAIWAVPEEEVAEVREMALASWAADRAYI